MRLRIPQTYPEAERTLWHAVFHLKYEEDSEAIAILWEAIADVQDKEYD